MEHSVPVVTFEPASRAQEGPGGRIRTIHAETPDGGATFVVRGLAFGVLGQQWTSPRRRGGPKEDQYDTRRAGRELGPAPERDHALNAGAFSDQQIKDALFAGATYLNLYTQSFLSGELRGEEKLEEMIGEERLILAGQPLEVDAEGFERSADLTERCTLLADKG